MKRMVRLAVLAAGALSVSSCMDMSTEIHVKMDGTATVSQTLYMTSSALAMMKLGGSKSLIDEAQLKAKATQMGKGVTYLGAEEVERQDGSKGYVAQYEVKNINELTLKNESVMVTPPGKNQSQSVSAGGKALWKFRFTPENEASLAIATPQEKNGGADVGSDGQAAGSGRQAAEEALAVEAMKLMFDGMRVRVHVRVDGTITETNARYVNPEKSGLTLLKIDFGKLLEDEKGSAQLQALGKQPKPEDVRARFTGLQDALPYIQIEDQKLVKVKFEDKGVQIALQPRDYDVWKGEWINTGSSLEDNVYWILRIQDVDDGGFTYSLECRDIPYGPNAIWSEDERASFRGPFSAADPDTGASFSLRINPNDRHDRVMEIDRLQQCSEYGNIFVFRRSVYRAGFDCDKAATSVETTICRNELLAQGDREMNTSYRELLETLPPIEVGTLRSAQRSWLQERNRECLTGDAVGEVCLARLYSDRLAALAKLKNSSLGAESRFDAAYALALVIRGSDLRQDTATRLAMYPLVMDPEGTVAWQADASGLLFEQTYTNVAPTHYISIGEVEFRYSDMLFVGSKGTVWTAAHTEPVWLEQFSEYEPWRVWMGAGRDPFMIRSDTGIEFSEAPATLSDLPDLVKSWLDRHPVSEPEKHSDAGQSNGTETRSSVGISPDEAVAYFKKNIPERGTVYLNVELGIAAFRKTDWVLSSKDVDHLLSLKNLRIVNVGLVKNRELKHLSALRKVDSLLFELVPGERLPDLAAFANLATLRISGKGLRDEDMARLCSNQSVRVLTLRHTGVSDEGLKCLQNMSSLSHLDIESDLLTDKAIPFFAALQKQSNSRFDQSNIRSKGFTEKGYERLRELKLERPPPEDNILF